MEENQTFAEGTLVVVWNADHGWQHALFDGLHKWLRPQTYPCDLCRLTYGLIRPKRSWTEFVEACGRPVHFIYRDQYGAVMVDGPEEPDFPMALERRDGSWKVLLSAREIQKIGTLEELIHILEEALRPND